MCYNHIRGDTMKKLIKFIIGIISAIILIAIILTIIIGILVFDNSNRGEKTSNTIGDNAILNTITLANILLEDRQLTYYTNNLNQPCIKIISSKHKNANIYVKDKSTDVVRYGLNAIDDSTVTTTTKKNHRLINDDDKKDLQ